MIKMASAKDKIIPLFTTLEPESEESPTVIIRGEEDEFTECLVRWSSASMSKGGCQIRIAKFKNGNRGLMRIRGKQHTSSMIFSGDEYYSLAQCIFRDSILIRQLCNRFPEGTDPTVDALRDFCSEPGIPIPIR